MTIRLRTVAIFLLSLVVCQGASVFSCSEKFVLPSSAGGAIPYHWVEERSGSLKVFARFTISKDARPEGITLSAGSFGLKRWISESIAGSTYTRACAGQTVSVLYHIFVHRKSDIDLPAIAIGPGNVFRLDLLEYVSEPLRPRER